MLSNNETEFAFSSVHSLDSIRSNVHAMNAATEGHPDQFPALVAISEHALQAIDRIIAEHPHWVAGWNMPGYLPESDPVVFSDWQEAHGYIHAEVQRFWTEDETADPVDYHPETSEADAKWLQIDTALHIATHGETFGAVNGDHSLIFWIRPATPNEVIESVKNGDDN